MAIDPNNKQPKGDNYITENCRRDLLALHRSKFFPPGVVSMRAQLEYVAQFTRLQMELVEEADANRFGGALPKTTETTATGGVWHQVTRTIPHD